MSSGKKTSLGAQLRPLAATLIVRVSPLPIEAQQLAQRHDVALTRTYLRDKLGEVKIDDFESSYESDWAKLEATLLEEGTVWAAEVVGAATEPPAVCNWRRRPSVA